MLIYTFDIQLKNCKHKNNYIQDCILFGYIGLNGKEVHY